MPITRHLIVRSRNTTCARLRELVVPSTTILRFGSTTPTADITRRTQVREINTAEACRVSGDKILMKKRFEHGHVPTAEWFIGTDNRQKVQYYLNKWTKMIIKHRHSSKGQGIYLISNMEDFENFLTNKRFNVETYIFEKYYTYSREYRLHVTKDGCFYTCRKMLQNTAQDRWHRHASNSVWVVEDNPLFDKPTNWNDIVKGCVNALKSVGLDIGAMDVKVQNNTHENPKYILLECNSAPSLGEIGIEKYLSKLQTIINNE